MVALITCKNERYNQNIIITIQTNSDLETL